MRRRWPKQAALAAALVTVCLLATATRADHHEAATGSEAATVSLQDLLERVRRGWAAEKAENLEREREFTGARDRQKGLLERSHAELARQEAISERLEKKFDENEEVLAHLEETLADKLGTLGEAFGVVRQVAGDTRGHIESSLTSSQIKGREDLLSRLGRSKGLPSIEELEGLWFILQQEMTETGRVVRFTAPVVRADGQEVEAEVVRVGAFNVISRGRYLHWLPEVGRLTELARQPAARHLGTADDLDDAGADDGMVGFAIDPSRGAILSLLVQTPSAGERIGQGGAIGYVIIVLGLTAAALGFYRFYFLIMESRRVKAEQAGTGVEDNALARVVAVGEANRGADTETLELKLDEAILKESGEFDRYLWVIKAVSVVAPLMGLLGTVTGMIETFQVITLFGTGDPKLMAGGISEALVTTMLGLVVAIPLLLLHAALSSNAKLIIDVLEERAAGLVATRAEQGTPGA